MPTQPKSDAAAGFLSIRGVRRLFGSVPALDGVSLKINPGEFFSLLGPSGCGKTTLLRIIGGLDHPSSGSVLLDGRDLLSIPAHQRPTNTVFQSYALFPHLTVAENIAFGLRMKKTPAPANSSRVQTSMDHVEVSPLSARKPAALSGGQRQRVALARALVNEPRLLLLDEPLAAVDQKLRTQLQSDLLRLQRRLGITFIYVTHDQQEALSLSDRLAVLNLGRVEQVGPPRSVYDSPQSLFVAKFLGHCNLIPADAAGSPLVRASFGEIDLARPVAPGPKTIFFRPESVQLGSTGFPGVVREVTFTGPETQVRIESGRDLIHAAILNSSHPAPALGAQVHWRAHPSSLTLFDSASGNPLP